MSLKNTVIPIIAFVLICAAAVVGVVYGVVSHEEPGMIEGVQPAWLDTIPVGVCVSSYGQTTTDPADLTHASGVVGAINQRLQLDVLRVVTNSPCLILIQYGVPSERTWVGDVASSNEQLDSGGAALLGARHCEVTVTNVTGEIRSLVVMHELGHCLGLAHDPQNSSIMRPVQTPTREGQYPPRISDSDVLLLRRLIIEAN